MAMQWLPETIRIVRPVFGQIVGVSAFINLLAVAAPVFVLQVYDRVVMHAGLSTLYGLLIGVAIAIGFDFVLRQLRARLLQSTALEIDIGVNRRVMGKLLSAPMRELEIRPVSYWETAFRDANTVRDTFAGPTAVAIADLPFAVLFLAVIYLIAAPIAWVVLLLLPLFVGLAWWGARVQSSRVRDERDALTSRDAIVTEIVAGRTTVKSLGLDDRFVDKWETSHARTIDRGLDRGRAGDNFVNSGLALSVIATVAITGIGALAILDQKLTIGALIATNMLASRIIVPFHQLVSTWRTVAMCRQSVARLDALFTLPEERAQSAIAFARPEGKLTLDGVSFRYRAADEPMVSNVRLTFEARGFYALVGANGSGKTTLLKIALGLYAPDEGRVLIDGADMSQFSRRDLTRWIGYVPQTVHLFAGTVRENIDSGRPGATDDDILAAARLSGVHDFVAALPDGYGTWVGEGGADMPGGIRQKIGIARALMSRPPIIILDEPTSNLDRESELALARTLRELSAEHTVIAATHSAGLLSACHSVLVLDRGRIAKGGEVRKILPELFAPATPAGATATTSGGGRT